MKSFDEAILRILNIYFALYEDYIKRHQNNNISKIYMSRGYHRCDQMQDNSIFLCCTHQKTGHTCWDDQESLNI